MTEAITTILPYAVGAAVSPLLFTVEVVILAGGVRPKARSWVYALGVLVVAILISLLIAFVFRGVEPSDSGPSPLERGVAVAIALVLIALAVRSFLPIHAKDEGKPNRLHEWMQNGKMRTFFVIGMIMMATNGSSIVIMIPGIHAVEALRPGVIPALAALGVLVLFVMIPAIFPVGVATAFGHRSDAFLARLNVFVVKHSRTIEGLICSAIAIYLLVDAFT